MINTKNLPDAWTNESVRIVGVGPKSTEFIERLRGEIWCSLSGALRCWTTEECVPLERSRTDQDAATILGKPGLGLRLACGYAAKGEGLTGALAQALAELEKPELVSRAPAAPCWSCGTRLNKRCPQGRRGKWRTTWVKQWGATVGT